MGAQYNGASPTPAMLNMDATPHTPGHGFGAGSQSGSDFDFGPSQSLTIDTMMQGGDGTGLLDHRSMPLPALPGYGNAFDQTIVPSGPLSTPSVHHHPSRPTQPDGHSPALERRHRLSTSSTSNGRHGSMTASEHTNPDAMLPSGVAGESHFSNNSNDSLTSEPRGADDGDSRTDDIHPHAPPSWSELKTKAGKERKRLPLACIACRRKKIRCSGEKPACKHCLRSRIPCVYKVTTRKAAPRTDYMAMLDKRLKRMEERVIKIIPKEEQGVVSSTGRAAVKPPLPPPLPRSAASSKKRAADAAFDEELDEWANDKTSVTAHVEEMVKGVKKEPLAAQDSDEHNMLQEGKDSLPSMELQEHLSEVFFDYVYCQSYPLLHKPSFTRKLAQGQVPPVLMLAVCAISARFSNHPELRTEPAFLRGEIWAAPAREIALRRYDTPNITILIVYLILGLHEFGTCQGGRSWMFGGMAQRMAYALQLHKDLDYEPRSRRRPNKAGLTFLDREIRRRTMWSCFLMDRFNSSGTERPIFIGEQHIHAQLPVKESYYQLEITGPTEDLSGNVPNPTNSDTGQLADAKDNMGVTAYLVRLVSIWGRLVNYMNLGGKDRDKYPMWEEKSEFRQIRQAIKNWKDGLPDSLVYTPGNVETHASENLANQFIFLHIAYHQVILFMNRFALPNPGSLPSRSRDMPGEFFTESYKTALEAANQISALVIEAMDYHVVAPFAGYSAYYSSTVHIHGAFSSNATLAASSKQNLAHNIKYLTKMKKYWGMFHFVTENLRDLYRKHADAARSGGKSGNRESGDQSIFQYGDWFDRYPHGVSGTDYEEPSADIKKDPGADAVLGQKSDLQTVEEFFSKLAPPTRAVQRDQKQAQTRKTAKRRNTKSEGRQSNGQPGQSVDAKPVIPPSGSEIIGVQSGSHTMSGYVQPPSGFSPGDLHHAQALMGQSPQHLIPQMDQQMIMDPYAGINSHANGPMQTTSHPMLDPTHQMNLDNYDFPALALTNSNTSPGGMFGDNSGAWFMPFNLEPPDGGEEHDFFGGSFDWTNMANFGEMPHTLQGIGLTPRGEIDAGQDHLAGTASGGVSDGMDGLR